MSKLQREIDLQGILNNPDVIYCYIFKNGAYYRSNCQGYTDYKYQAGVYEKSKAVSEAMACDQIIPIPINIKEHNMMIRNEMLQLERKLL